MNGALTPAGFDGARQRGYLIALMAIGASGLAELVVSRSLGASVPWTVWSMVVLVTAWLGGSGPALLATCGTTLIAYLSARAPGRFALGDPDAIVPLLLFMAAGLLISLVVHRLRQDAHSQQQARRDLEERLRQADQLHQLTAALLQGRTAADVVDAALPDLVHAVGASAGALFLVDEERGECQLGHALGYGGRVATPEDRWPLAGTPFAGAVARRELTVVHGSARVVPDDGVTVDPVLEPQDGDLVIPLVSGGRTPGVVVLRIPRALTPAGEEREFLTRSARHVGQALDRGRMYESAERARADAEALRIRADSELRERQKAEAALRLSEARYRALAARTSRLYALNAGLSEAVSLAAVAKVTVRHGKVVAGASAASVVLLVEQGRVFETLHADDYGAESKTASRRFPASSGLCATAVVASERPVFIGSFVEWQEKYPESASLAADGGYSSSAALPLLADGSVIGVLSFHFTLPVNFDDEYTALLTSVAQHCAQALDRARLFESAERARADAEAANRSKDDFLSTISHELRTPLNAILGWAAMLRSGTVDAGRSQRAIDAIFNNATRQGRLIEELLDVSSIVAGRVTLDRQEVDLGENIRGAVEAMMPMAAAKGVDVRLDAPHGIQVDADPRRLEQVFLNLLSNAVKFTPQGGSVTVSATLSGGVADIRVADTGVGIEPAFLPHAFDRFRQGDSAPTRAAGGLGLGLFISKQIVDALGGTIRAESAGSGQGASFILTLPAAMGTNAGRQRSANVAAAESAPAEPLPDLDGVSVLLVDDEADAREVMASALEACGATVIHASSAGEALDTLSKIEVDLLLSDIAMPGQDGYELIRRVRSLSSTRLAAMPAAAVTAHARNDERERALAAGFHMHLTKPVHPGALAAAVAALAASRPVAN